VKLADGERVFFHGHPSWRSMVWFHAKGFLWAVVAGAAAGILSAVIRGRVEASWAAAAVVLVFVVALGAGLVNRQRITYTITSRRLSVETGLLARETHETRLEQVQDINATQSLFDRLLGVGTVAFDTASGSVISFAGVDDPEWVARIVDEAL
jgi:uncharacterized membrane protein YdbT with pleckstrin-like domain